MLYGNNICFVENNNYCDIIIMIVVTNNFYHAESTLVINVLYGIYEFLKILYKKQSVFSGCISQKFPIPCKRQTAIKRNQQYHPLLSVEDEQSSSEHLALFFTLSLSQLPAILYLPTYPQLAFMN